MYVSKRFVAFSLRHCGNKSTCKNPLNIEFFKSHILLVSYIMNYDFLIVAMAPIHIPSMYFLSFAVKKTIRSKNHFRHTHTHTMVGVPFEILLMDSSCFPCISIFHYLPLVLLAWKLQIFPPVVKTHPHTSTQFDVVLLLFL